MATTTRYTLLGAGANFMDFYIPYGIISLDGQELLLKGSSGVDQVYVGSATGLSFDFTQAGLGVDKVYLEGSWADYGRAASGSALTLTRTTGGSEVIKVINGDSLTFANGTVSVLDALNFTKGITTSEPVPAGETSTAFPIGVTAPLNNTVRAVVQDAAGETIALTRPGVALIVKGGSGVDVVYVNAGTTVDGTQLGLGQDKLYLTGNWADYAGTYSGSAVTLTRTVGSDIETVKFLGGSDTAFDSIVFADGATRSVDILNFLKLGTLFSLASPGTPLPGPTVSIATDDSALNIGDTATLTFTLSEAASNFVDGDVTVSGGALSGFSGSGASYSATFTPAAGFEGVATVNVAAATFTNAEGQNNSSASPLLLAVDTQAPNLTITSNTGVIKSGETATVTFAFSEAPAGFNAGDVIATGGTLAVYTIQATDAAAITYSLGGTDASLFDLDASTGTVSFKTSPDYETPADAGADNTYDLTVTATDAAGNAANQAVALTVTNVVEVGDDVIDLGVYGKLIAPVNVDGNWYYHWDRSGDGTSVNVNRGVDDTNHNVLDGIFNRDINGVTNTTVLNADGLYGTTDTYRYATLNGVQLALPTANGGAAYPNEIEAFQPGTTIDNNPAGETNPAYSDLLAIWDGYNGTGTGTVINGTPSGWAPNFYWSATPSTNGHALVSLSSGYVRDFGDSDSLGNYVALQVLFPDTTPPTVSSIAITSATGIQNSTLNAGDVISVTVTLSEATTVTGTPQLALNIGGTTVQANYASGSGTTALVFTYPILANQTDANGISIAADSLTLNGGTLKDAAGNDATLTHALVTDNAGYVVDTTAPTVLSIAITSATGIQNSTLNAGDVVSVTVTMSDVTTVTGTPQLALDIGSATVQASYASGSGSTALVFTYTILANQTDANGISITADSLTLNGGTLKDAAGNAATLTHAAVADNAGYLVDTTAPTANLLLLAIPPVQLEAIGNTSNSDVEPQVTAVGSAGEYVVTWAGYDSANDFSIFVQKFNADGTTTGNTPVQLEAIGNTAGTDFPPQIAAVGSGGAYVVTWWGSDSAGDFSIFVQKFNADGTTTGNTRVQLEAIGKTNGRDDYPQVTAVGSAGEYVVTWHGMDNANDYSIFVQKFNADGTTTSNTPVQLEAIGNTLGIDYEPQVTAVGSAGEYVVTWWGDNSVASVSIFVQKFNADGTTTNNTPVQLDATAASSRINSYPQVTAVGSAGEYVVTWEGWDSAADYSIFVQKFNADGTTTGNTVQLEAIGNATGNDRYPQITAVGSAGAYVVTWQGIDSAGDQSIFVQKFSADGAITGSTVKLDAIDNTPGNDFAPQITAVGSAGEYVVTWYGTDSAGDLSIFVQKFNADGTTTGFEPVQLEAVGKTDDWDEKPQVTAVGSAGAYVVTWGGMDSANDHSIFVQKFNADGTTTLPPLSWASGNAVVRSSEVGTAYLVNSTVTVTDVASITAAADNQWNQVAITAINTDTNLAATGLADGTYKLYTADAAGNLSTAAANTVTVDAAPVFSSGASASFAEDGVGTVYDATADDDTGVAYTLGGNDGSLFNLDASTGAVTFKASPDFEAPTDANADNVYQITITATDIAGNAVNQNVAISVTDVVETSLAGQDVIDLGEYGKLLAPVQVDGNWYYVWDMNGDGAHNDNQDATGQLSYDGSVANAGGSGYQYDFAYHDVLDGLFTQDASGNANPGGDTTDVYRYATLNGVKVALPTANGGMAYPNGIDNYQPGTVIDNDPAGEANPAYDDLLAVWDAFNGSSTGTDLFGTPPGWQDTTYWSATPSGSGHAIVALYNGFVGASYDWNTYHVALEVV